MCMAIGLLCITGMAIVLKLISDNDSSVCLTREDFDPVDAICRMFFVVDDFKTESDDAK